MKRKMLTIAISIMMIFAAFVPIVAEGNGEESTTDQQPAIIDTINDYAGDNIENDDEVQLKDEPIISDDAMGDYVNDGEVIVKNDEQPEEVTAEPTQETEVGGEDIENETVIDDSTKAVTVTKSKDETYVKSYSTINGAIAEIAEYQRDENPDVYTIKLNSDIKEDVVIPKNRNITIDLNGHRITNVSDHTITNNSSRAKLMITVHLR